MKIAGLSGILPSRIVSNQDVINLVEEHSKSRGKAEKDPFCMGWAGSGGKVFSALSFTL